MEHPLNPTSTVDTSRPFRSVKEAVAIFGDRLLAGDLHASSRPTSTAIVLLHKNKTSLSPPPSPISVSLETTVKKLEAELEETKEEIKMLKERESETGVALATLTSELQSLAAAEVSAAARSGVEVEERRREVVMTRVAGLPTLAEILSSVNVGGQRDNKRSQKHHGYGYGFGENKVMAVKKKPIVPLVGDLFVSWRRKKKGSTSAIHNPMYSSQLYLD